MSDFVPLGFVAIPDAVRRVAEAKSMRLDEAWSHLRPLLHAGVIEGGYLSGGRIIDNRSEWASPGARDAFRTGVLRVLDGWNGYDLPAFIKQSSLEAYIDGRLAEGAPDATQKPELDARQNAPAQMTNVETRRPSGRPPKAGADDFWVEVCRLIHLGEQGAGDQTQKAFVDAMNEWCSNNMASPYGDDAISKKIKMVWRALALGKTR